jgi:hypothetical protein
MPRGFSDGKDAPNSEGTITASAKPVGSKIVVAIQIGTAQESRGQP